MVCPLRRGGAPSPKGQLRGRARPILAGLAGHGPHSFNGPNICREITHGQRGQLTKGCQLGGQRGRLAIALGGDRVARMAKDVLAHLFAQALDPAQLRRDIVPEAVQHLALGVDHPKPRSAGR